MLYAIVQELVLVKKQDIFEMLSQVVLSLSYVNSYTFTRTDNFIATSPTKMHL